MTGVHFVVMASEEFYREAARRTHRTLGSYLVQWAWTNDVDCVVVERKAYLHFVDMLRMPTKRINWLTQDVESVFEYAAPMWITGQSKWSTIYLSRRPFPDPFPHKSMSTRLRVKKLNSMGLRTAVVQVPSEKVVVEAMARVACGLEDFHDAPWAP